METVLFVNVQVLHLQKGNNYAVTPYNNIPNHSIDIMLIYWPTFSQITEALRDFLKCFPRDKK